MQRTAPWTETDKVISIALIFAGLGGLLFALTADLLGFGGSPGWGPNQVAVAAAGSVLLITGILLTVSLDYRQIGEWVLVVAAVFAAAFGADLLIIGGLPSSIAKQVPLLSVAFGLIVLGIAPAAPAERRSLSGWLQGLSIDRVRVGQFLTVVVQLALLALVIEQFRLENQAFYHNLTLLVFYGFILHFFLPARYRMAFFLMLSVAGILGLFGVTGGSWILIAGLALISISHLPVPLRVRMVLLLAAGIGLALARAGQLPSPVPPAVWPILGSLFMFRMVVYLYDLGHPGKLTFDATSTLSYFFLLPNLVFPLFPVVDYSTFRRTYYDKDEFQIYQTGVRWILRGVFQLIAYRFINYYLVISPQEVASLGDLVRYLVPNFMLIIRVTGQFHLAVGILHLFGFNLPLTNNRFFLSTSFNDFWRRANIYWKDFMLKVFYYPVYFRLKSLSDLARLTLATIVVFILTWAFHSYQWFWLRGSVLLSAPDMLYWGFFGLLILANSLYEARYGRRRSLGQAKWQVRDALVGSLRALGVFATIAILWGLWTSPSVSDYLGLLSVVGEPLQGFSDLLPLLIVVGAIFAAKFWYSRIGEENANKLKDRPFFFRDASLTAAAILGIFVLGTPGVQSRVGGQAGQVMADLTVARLSDRDADLLLRGYYEDLVGINRFNTELWEVYNKRPSDWPLIQETDAARLRDDFESIELVPSISIDFHGARFSTNRWGMRDQDYEQVPAPGTYRVALLGPSFVMGSGVADGRTFEWLLEDRLNAEMAGADIQQFEILNFGVAGYAATQELYALENRALPFGPQAVFIVSHQLEIPVLIRNLASPFVEGVEIPYAFMREIGERAGIESGMTQGEVERRLQPFGEELTLKTYQHMVEVATANDLQAVWIFMPTPEEAIDEAQVDRLHELAAEAGFEVISLRDVYEGQDLDQLIVAEWDRHPNARGHQLIADLLYQRILEEGVLPTR